MKKRWVFVNVVALAVLVYMGNASANMTPSADFDGDGIVGFSDFLLFVEKFGARQGDEKYEAKYDLDDNGEIVFSDFLVFVDSFGTEGPSQTVSVSVCDRTNAVRDSIVALVPVSTCGDVTAAHLAEIDSLSLSGAGLAELKAGDFSGLTCLTKLNLRENRLSGLPADLFDDLPALSWLHLGSNQLTAIPSELFTLSNLTELYLWGNQLTGEMPAALGNLSNLTVLDLGGNQLTGEIPTELFTLSNLTQVTLHTNQLTGEIPTALGNLSNLEVLWLQDNASLMGALPQSLSGLTKLQQFYFNNTGLCAPLDAAFQAWLQGITDHSGSNCSG